MELSMVCRFAGKYEGLVSESVPQVSYAFFSNSFLDDLAYAAAWLHKATGKPNLHLNPKPNLHLKP